MNDREKRNTRLQLRLCKERIRVAPSLLIGLAQTGTLSEH